MKLDAPNVRRVERKNLGEKLFLAHGCNGIHLYRLKAVAGSQKHVGRGAWGKWGKRGTKFFVWGCFACEHYATGDIIGRKAICWECGESFIVGKARRGGRERKVRCGECGGSGMRIGGSGGEKAAPTLSPFAEAVMDGMIPDEPEE